MHESVVGIYWPQDKIPLYIANSYVRHRVIYRRNALRNALRGTVKDRVNQLAAHLDVRSLVEQPAAVGELELAVRERNDPNSRLEIPDFFQSE